MIAVLFGIQIRRKDRVDRIEVAIRRESKPLSSAKCLPPPAVPTAETEPSPESRPAAS